MQQLITQATALGLTVIYRNLGHYSGILAKGGLVVLNPNRSQLTKRVTLAHEMGHWHHGHDWTTRHDRECDEREADLYAAKLLISPTEYALAERLHGPHPGAIATELGVTRRLVELWRDDFAIRRYSSRTDQSIVGLCA